MKKVKHTQGPWHFEALLSGSENHRGFRVYGHGARGWVLAEVKPVDQEGAEGEANARLIAAAPELLDELDRAAWQLEYIGRECREVVPGALAIQCEIKAKLLRAAIAKATGVPQ